MLNEPTTQSYAELQQAFDHFNRELFDGQLKNCLLTFQREKRAYGYFSSERFVHRDGQSKVDEIAINPSYFAVVPPLEIMQTVVHEMVHAWQHHFGTPSRRGYHNQEWANKMESIGLMPSSTGAPGGARVGEKMGDYAIEGGRFLAAATALLATPNYAISWLDRIPPDPPRQGLGRSPAGSRKGKPLTLSGILSESVSIPEVKENKSNRVKQRCPTCAAQVWGKPGLKVLCGEEACHQVPMEPVGQATEFEE